MSLEFELHLKSINDLFVFDSDGYDPFHPRSIDEGGLEHVMSRITGRWLFVPDIRTTIYLPKDKYHPGLEERARAAVQRYADAQLAVNRNVRSDFFTVNGVFMLIGVIILLVGLWLSPRISQSEFIADPELRATLSFGIDVLIWVALWTPLSAFVMDWYPHFRKMQELRALRAMELRVLPEPEDTRTSPSP